MSSDDGGVVPVRPCSIPLWASREPVSLDGGLLVPPGPPPLPPPYLPPCPPDRPCVLRTGWGAAPSTLVTAPVIRGPPLGRLVSSEPESGPWRLLFPLLAFILVVRGSSVRLLRLTSSDPVPPRFNSIDPDPVTGPESVGSESVGLESVGPEGVGSVSVGPDGVSPESVGPESVGSESVGSDSVGSDSVGPESVGSESVCSDSVIPPTIEQRKRPSLKTLCRAPSGGLTIPTFGSGV
jgi:hypothetical protein